MKGITTISLSALATAAVLTLAACGGGGDGGSSTPTDNSSGNGSNGSNTGGNTAGVVPPQTSVGPSTYAADAMAFYAYTKLNNYRAAMGVGLLAQDPILDRAAQAHALYINSNLASGAITALSHDELPALANYYGATPLSRARKAGVPTNEWIGENVAAGMMHGSASSDADDCIDSLLSTVYHLQSLTYTQQTVGIGYQQETTQGSFACVLDSGQIAGVSGTPEANSLLTAAGQLLPQNIIATSPYDSEGGVAIKMASEVPNPAPDIAAPGRPILVRVGISAAGQVLNVTSMTLTAADGTVLPGRILVSQSSASGSSGVTADPNGILGSGTVVLLPLVPLSPNSRYTVSFTGVRTGINASTPISKTWSFTTKA
ncbi:CAP domain-containing protein [Burkholderia mayonis]|uniref:SCP domain-containing protein n=1 Tax=Burkholderia mayonis TaxID=1385591 RepID=A0A1B4G2J4_9BURK|nr:CAP domain-containing protein [Burkholderia mayonis]AOJ10100.1 hypothetical protein WS71_22935 [Burkholderia mayonis]KVE51473.1 hypothetical protein WS71_12395 [Burkholderia mayonis]